MGAAEQFMEAFKVGYSIGDQIQTKRADSAIYEGLTELQTGLERIRSGALPADDPNFINDLLSTRARINGQFASSSLTYDQLKDITTQYQGLDNQVASAVLSSALPRWGSDQSAQMIGNYIMSGDPDTSYTSEFSEHPETGEPVLVVTPSDGDPVMISQQQAATRLELARGGGLGVWETNAGLHQAQANLDKTMAGTRYQEALTGQVIPAQVEATQVGTEATRTGIRQTERVIEALPTGEEADRMLESDLAGAAAQRRQQERVTMALPTGEEAEAQRSAALEATRAGTEQTERTTETMATPEEARAARAASLEAAETSTEQARLVMDALPSGEEAVAARAADLAMSEAQRTQIEAQVANMPPAERARAIEDAELAYRTALTEQVTRQTSALPDEIAAEAMRAADLAASEASTAYQRTLTADVAAQTEARPTGAEARRIRSADLSNVQAGTKLTKAQTDALVQENKAALAAAATPDFDDLPAVQQLSDPDFLMTYIESDTIGGGAGVTAFLADRTRMATQAKNVAVAAAGSGVEDIGADEAIELSIRGIDPAAIPIAVRRQQNYERSQKRNNQLTAKQRADAARRAIDGLLKLPILDEYRVD